MVGCVSWMFNYTPSHLHITMKIMIGINKGCKGANLHFKNHKRSLQIA